MLRVLSKYRQVTNLNQNVRCISFLKLKQPSSDSLLGPHIYPSNSQVHLQLIRRKYDKSKKVSRSTEEDSDDDDSDEEFKDDKNVIKTKVNSLRADLILKAGLGIARNKIEVIFYENKIRVNGLKITKKSVNLNIGDEIDVVRGINPANPSLLNVSRVEILSAAEKDESIQVQLRRTKNMLIENYKGPNIYKSSQEGLA